MSVNRMKTVLRVKPVDGDIVRITQDSVERGLF